MDIGYSLSSDEEHSPTDLVRLAVRAEEAGFRFALISDHYHPWVPRQGHSAFVWSVIGAMAAGDGPIVTRYRCHVSDDAHSSSHHRAGGGKGSGESRRSDRRIVPSQRSARVDHRWPPLIPLR